MPNLLLTLMLGGHSETYSIQTESQSVLMLGSPVSMAAVEVSEGGVQLRATHGYTIFPAEGEPVAKVALRQDAEAIFALGSTQDQIPLPVCEQQLGAVLYSRPSSQGSRQYKKLGFSVDADVLIGRSPTAHWHYDSHYVSSSHARLTLVGEDFSITDLGSANGTFVNGEILTPHVSSSLAYGDVVTILDLTFMVGHRFIALNQPIGFRCGEIVGARFIDHETFKELCPPASETSDELPLFFPAPRLAHTIHSKTFQIDDPPAMKKPDNRPAIMQIGPSFMMGIASVFSAATAIQRLSQGGDVMSCLPSLAMCVAMLSGMVIWPLISQHYTKRRDAEEERRRQARYTDYLNGMEARFRKECDTQAEILRIGRTSVTDLEQRAEILSPSLMNRSAYHDDFMELRVGVGSCALKADFHWPQQRFSLDNDKLLDNVEMLAKNPPKVIDVPLAFNPVQHFIAGILGPRSDVWSFARGLVIQACSFYGYQDVKLVLIADKKEEAEWSFMRALPHLFDDLGQRRFLACDYDGLAELSMQLERVLEQRLDIKMDKVGDYGSYYLIFCANKRLAERSDTIDRLTSLRTNK